MESPEHDGASRNGRERFTGLVERQACDVVERDALAIGACVEEVGEVPGLAQVTTRIAHTHQVGEARHLPTRAAVSRGCGVKSDEEDGSAPLPPG